MTANYLTGKEKVTANFAHTPSKAELTIKNASKHNLKGVDVKIRL
jgi:excinuclease UvrABC ATPase subunit